MSIGCYGYGGEAIFEENCMFFFPFLGEKKYKMWTKIGKMFNYATFLMFSKKKFSIFSFSCQILNFGEIQDGGQDGGQFDDVTGPPQRHTP